MPNYEQLQRLNAIEQELARLYYKENTDPKGERLCRALDILEGARSAIGQLANEESKAIREGK